MASDGELPFDQASPASTAILESTVPPPFVSFRPRNVLAKREFSEIVQGVIDGKFKHHYQYLQSDPAKAPLLGSATHHEGVNLEPDTETEPETEHDSGQSSGILGGLGTEMVWTGYYFLSLNMPPCIPTAGWRIGTGRFRSSSNNPDPTGGVDILLSDDRRRTNVRGAHASFFFDKWSGVLLLRAIHGSPNGVTLDGVTFGGSVRALNRRKSIIKLGELEYDFAFNIQPNSSNDQLFKIQKVEYFLRHLAAPAPLEVTSATVSQYDMTMGAWTLRGGLGEGSFGTVSAAVHLDGTIAAIKQFARKSTRKAEDIRKEVDMAKEVKMVLEKESYRRVIRLLDVIYSSERPEYDGRLDDKVWILYTPVASGTLGQLVVKKSQDVKFQNLLSFFKQTLDGLAFLHKHGFVHRDIKPVNIGVLSLEPPQAVILDLGHMARLTPSTSHFSPTPGQVGTITHLSPEMEYDLYNELVDMWALGVTGYELFSGRHPWPLSFNPWSTNELRRQYRHLYEDSISQLSNRPRDIGNLLRRMLAWNPKDRISAEDGLAHLSLSDVVIEDIPLHQDVTAGMKRKADAQP